MEYPQYNPQSDNLPLSDEELSTLDDMLARLPSDGAMNIEALDGYLSGLLLSPQPLAELPGSDWLPLVWGGDGEEGQPDTWPFVSGKQKKRVMLLVLRHLRAIAHQWELAAARPEAWEPIFSIAEVDEQDLTDAGDWSLGFLSAVDLAPGAWKPLFETAETAALLEPITLLGSDESQLSELDAARLADPLQRDALSRAVPDQLLQLLALRQAS
ncbi:UPF0149 family protein [Roseateles cavernae]|uniref:UPF0149 family protein n=1 Tax=Roseateles cavernae TaxID=3153578 RepID=UPI0032E3C8B4